MIGKLTRTILRTFAFALALCATSGAWAADPTAEWYGGTYGTADTRFPVSAEGVNAVTSTKGGLTISKNNTSNTSTADYMLVKTTKGWPITIGGMSYPSITVVVGYTLASDYTGTIIGLANSAGTGRFRANVVNKALKSGQGTTLSRADLGVSDPVDGNVHFLAMSYSYSTGAIFYFDGVKRYDDTGLKEDGKNITEVCLGAVRGPLDIINGIKFHYVAVYNNKISDSEARAAYERAFVALNGVQVSRSIAANATVNWSDSAWTVGDEASSAFTPDSETGYDVTITVGGDCTINMPNSIGSFRSCDINFELAENVASANVSLVYPETTLGESSAETTHINSFGRATVSAGSGITLTPSYGGNASGYKALVSGCDLYIAKRPSVGVVSVRIGARTQEASGGYISPAYESVGPYPMSGIFWNQTKFWNDNSASGNYTDIQNLTDAEDDSSAIRIGYYGHNTYFNTNKGNDASTPNRVLTATYLDDSDSGNGALTATASVGGETITLPTPGHNRGWQLHFENIPYSAYDVYFVTASDVDSGLKECPIYVSLDGGTTWKSYMGDSVNEKTVMGTDSWTGLHYAVDGNLVHGKNYIKMRITKSIYGDNIGTIDITHGVRNTDSKIRSGLAAIQIVEVENDGVYTLNSAGDWSGNIWDVGDLTDQSWSDTVEGEASIAKIESSATIDSVTVDRAVSADSVILTGSDPFTVAGYSTLTVSTGFDASAFTGELNLQAPISGTVYIGANTSLEFGGDSNMTLPAYTLDGAGAWTKVGTGVLTVNNGLALACTVTGGAVDFTTSTTGNITLNGGNLKFTGSESEILYDGAATLANSGTGKTIIESGTVQSRGNISTDIDVNNGAVLKLGTTGGFGSSGVAASGKTIIVNSGGVVELNGYEGCNAYTLNGGTLRNTGTAIGSDQRQTMGLTLTADSTVHAGSEFGLVNSGHNAVTVSLGGHKLTKTGSGNFIMINTTVNGTSGSKIEVAEGSLQLPDKGHSSTVNVPVSVAANTTVQVDFASEIQSISGAGSVSGSAMLTTSGLDLSDGLTVATPVTLKNGATVTLGTGSITGAITIPDNATVTFDASGFSLSTASADLVTGLTIGSGTTVTVSGLNSAYDYVVDTENNKIRAYQIVAIYDGEKYATIQEAIDAAGDANLGDIVVTDSSAEVPEGYVLVGDTRLRKVGGNIYWTGGTYWAASGGSAVFSTAASGGDTTTYVAGDTVVIPDTTKRWYGPISDGAKIVFSCGGTIDVEKTGDLGYAFKNADITIESGTTVNFKKDGYGVNPEVNGGSISGDGAITVANGATLVLSGVVELGITPSGETVNVASGAEVSCTGSATISSTLAGTGEISFATLPSSALTFDDNWTGTVELPVLAANQAYRLNNYGKTGSTIRLNGLSAGWLEVATPITVNANLELAGDWNLSAMSTRVYNFATVSGTGNMSFATAQHQPTSINIDTLSGYTGTITNNTEATLTIGTLALGSGADVTLGAKLLSTGGTGRFSVTAVTVGGEAQTLTLSYRSDGVYVRSDASYNNVKYVTIQDAIDAAEQAGGTYADVTILDPTATCPDGYYIDTENNNSLAMYQAAYVLTDSTKEYFKTAQLAVDDIQTAENATAFKFSRFEVYYGTEAAMSIDLSAAAWSLLFKTVKVKCLDGATVVVTTASDEYTLSASAPDEDGIVTYAKTAKAATYVWVATSQSDWYRPTNWKVDSAEGATASRAPGSTDEVVFSNGASVSGVSGISVAELQVSGTVTLSGSGTLTSDSAITLGANATISLTGVTLSPEPTAEDTTNYRVRKTTVDGTTTYTVVDKVGTIFSVY